MAASKSKPSPRSRKKSSPRAGKRTISKKTASKRPTRAAKSAPVAKKKTAKRASGKILTKRAAEAPRATKAIRSTPARDALTALAQKKSIESALSPVDDTAVVESYLRDVDHPYKAEMQAVRRIILGSSPKILERIKWNAPSFHYKEDLGAFNPRATEYAHLILLFPGGAGIPTNLRWLEGKHKDRREVKFESLEDVERKKPALEKLVKRWVALRDE